MKLYSLWNKRPRDGDNDGDSDAVGEPAQQRSVPLPAHVGAEQSIERSIEQAAEHVVSMPALQVGEEAQDAPVANSTPTQMTPEQKLAAVEKVSLRKWLRKEGELFAAQECWFEIIAPQSSNAIAERCNKTTAARIYCTACGATFIGAASVLFDHLGCRNKGERTEAKLRRSAHFKKVYEKSLKSARQVSDDMAQENAANSRPDPTVKQLLKQMSAEQLEGKQKQVKTIFSLLSSGRPMLDAEREHELQQEISVKNLSATHWTQPSLWLLAECIESVLRGVLANIYLAALSLLTCQGVALSFAAEV
jgi:hypothetical protein